MIIAMMSHTYDKRLKQNDEIWKVEIFSRIIRFEKLFPELWSIAHKPQKVSIRVYTIDPCLLHTLNYTSLPVETCLWMQCP